MKKKDTEIDNLRFTNVIKEVCDEKKLRFDQVKDVVLEVMHRTAVALVEGRSTHIRGFGSIVVRMTKPKVPNYRIVLKDGRIFEGENKPKMKFSVFVDKKIDPTKNYQ